MIILNVESSWRGVFGPLRPLPPIVRPTPPLPFQPSIIQMRMIVKTIQLGSCPLFYLHRYKGQWKIWQRLRCRYHCHSNTIMMGHIWFCCDVRMPKCIVIIIIMINTISAGTGTCWRGTTQPSASSATGPAWLHGAKKVSPHNCHHHHNHHHHHHHFTTVSELSGEKCTCQSCETKC